MTSKHQPTEVVDVRIPRELNLQQQIVAAHQEARKVAEERIYVICIHVDAAVPHAHVIFRGPR